MTPCRLEDVDFVTTCSPETRDTCDAMSVSCCLPSDHNDSKEEDEILKSEQNPAETNNNTNSDNNNVVVVTKLKTNSHITGGYVKLSNDYYRH